MSEHTSPTESVEQTVPDLPARHLVVPSPRQKISTIEAAAVAKRPGRSEPFSRNDDDPGPAAA
jgi:hypothetical protein